MEPSSATKKLFNSKILCANCNRPLSVGPIYMYENVGTFCGRCPSPSPDTNPIHVTIYEKLANRFHFPCSNQLYGCNYLGMFNEIARHENNCPKQMISCPMGEKCAIKNYTVDGIVKHFKENHRESILLKTVWDCDVKNEHLCVYFIQQACLVFQGELIGEDFHFFVSFIGTTKNLYEKYNLLVLSSDGKQSLSFNGKLICGHDEENVAYCTVPKESLKCLTANSEILRLFVSLVPKLSNDENYLKTCQICGKRLLAEVKLCYNGHDLCENCTITNNFDCKLCNDANNLPQKQTTFYINLNNEITYDCPLNERTKCGFHSNVNKIIEHFTGSHKNIYKNELPNTFKLIKEQPVIDYLYLNKKLFIFEAVYKQRKIKINLTLFNDDEDKKYSFVLDFKKNGKNFQFIEPVSVLNESTDEIETCLELHEHMLRPFIEKDCLSFVMSIQNSAKV